MKKLLSVLAFSAMTTLGFAQKTLVSDPPHSRVQFAVTHLGINDINGGFDTATLTINADEKSFVNSKLTFEVVPESMNTNVDARDKHLKSADFFDTATYPKMVFSSTSIKKNKMKNYYTVTGNLLMHGVTKPVTATLIYRGATVNPNNKTKTYGYQVLATLKRSDFGIGPKFPEAMISDLVRIKGDFELTEK